MAFSGKHKKQAEKKFQDNLVNKVGCVCCRWHGQVNHYCTIHHIDGKTKPHSQWYVLPLCAAHHQKGTNTDHQWILARHGDKSHWEKKYGTEHELYLYCFQMLGYIPKIPQDIKDYLNLD